MHAPLHDPRRPPTSVTLRVTGLHCTNCALSLEKHLLRVGANSPTVDYATGSTKFLLADPEKLPDVVRSIQRLGYTVLEEGQTARSARHQTLHIKTAIAAIFTLPMLVAMFLPHSSLHDPWLQFFLATPCFIIGITHFGASGIRSIRAGVANMDVLIALGVLAGYTASVVTLLQGLSPETIFFEATSSIVTFVLIGHLLEERAVRKTTSSIESLAALQPPQAIRIIAVDHDRLTTEEIPVGSIQRGDLLQVNTGDKIPTDSVIERGVVTCDESMLSGESLPVEHREGERVIGGSIVLSGSAVVRASAVGDDTVLASIVRLVQEAQQRKPAIQRVGDSVSAVFVPGVIVTSIVVLSLGIFLFDVSPSQALVRALAIAVVACPCAMGLATPTAIMVALGRAATSGILIRGGDTLERLASVGQVSFDKTGTLTAGTLRVGDLSTFNGCSPSDARAILVALQQGSSHPIAKTIVKTFQGQTSTGFAFTTLQETRGFGIEGTGSDGSLYVCGGRQVQKRFDLAATDDIVLVKDGRLIASLTLRDEVRPEAPSVIAEIQRLGLTTALISGDTSTKSEEVAQAVGIANVYAEQLPEDKLAVVRAMQHRQPLAYVGDGINDAPTLAEASVGISLRSASDVAMHSSQVLLMGGSLHNLPSAIRLARLTVTTIKQNLFWAFLYNIITIPLAALGFISPLVGALLMTGSDVLIVANSLRIRFKKI